MSDRLKQGLTDLSYDVQVVDLRDRVLKGSRRIGMRNRAVGSLAVVVALAGAFVAINGVRPMPPPPPGNSPTPTVTSSPDNSPSPTSAPTQLISDVRNATFRVPAFPGAASCPPAGERTFKDGQVTSDDTTLSIADRQPTVADIDGLPGSEVLINISCEFTNAAVQQVLALRVDMAGRFEPIGFVLPGGLDLDTYDEVRVAAGVIQVPVLRTANSALDKQVRGYALQGGGFGQVSGPTTFPPAIVDVRAIDWRSTTFFLRLQHHGDLFMGYAKVAGGTGEAILSRRSAGKHLGTTRFMVTVDSVAFVKNAIPAQDSNGSAWLLVTMRDPIDVIVQGVYVFERDLDGPRIPTGLPEPIVQTDKDNVYTIEKLEGAGDTAKLTVSGKAGQQVWSYRHSLEQGWTRIG